MTSQYLRSLFYTIFCLSYLIASSSVSAAFKPEQIAIVYNKDLPESESLAKHYAKVRSIPASQLIAISPANTGHITRDQFEKTIQTPLREVFTNRKWFQEGTNSEGKKQVVNTTIKVCVLMKGIPFGIKRTGKQDEASVDSELCLLSQKNAQTESALKNPYYNMSKDFTDTTGANQVVMLVGRIDAPSYTDAKRLIDDAVAVEKTGLWGFCYLDRANFNDGKKTGDEWLDEIETVNWKIGIPTAIDKQNRTLPHHYPMQHAAMYFGWYTEHVNGPFKNPDFKLKKGAIAVHLHSFSGRQLHNSDIHWHNPRLHSH